jgi:hypothetical protein
MYVDLGCDWLPGLVVTWLGSKPGYPMAVSSNARARNISLFGWVAKQLLHGSSLCLVAYLGLNKVNLQLMWLVATP